MSALTQNLHRNNTAPAILLRGQTISYAELRRSVDELTSRAPAPSSALRIYSGANELETIIQITAALTQRQPLALLHPRLTAAERAAQTKFLKDNEFAVPSDAAIILFTSGSSGQPKAVCLSRAALIASAIATEQHLGREPLERWLLCLPLCHVAGLSILTRALVHGTSVVLEPGFDPGACLSSAQAHQISGASLVPTQLYRLVQTARENISPQNLNSALAPLGLCIIGGAATAPELLNEALGFGLRALGTYGLTETCAQVCLEPLSAARRPGAERSSGRVLGANLVQLQLDQTQPERRQYRGAAPISTDVGRILVSGPSLFSGYLGLPEITPPFDTGDLGWLDEQGELHVLGRASEMIISGGENIYPIEIEEALLASGYLEQALVFGEPSLEWGQSVAAVLIAPKALAHSTLLELLSQHLAKQLAPFKRPRRVAFIEQLHQLPNGKIDRRPERYLSDPELSWLSLKARTRPQ